MKKIIIYSLAIFLTAMFMAPTFAGAADNTQDLKEYKFSLQHLKVKDQKQAYLWENESQTQSPVVSILLRAIEILTYTIGSLALVALILAGLWMVTSHGDQAQLEKGKKMLTSALVGLALAFSSYIIITFIQSLLK